MSEPRCTCTEDESSDGSATYEDDPYCPIHGVAAEARRLLAESERVRRQLAEALRQRTRREVCRCGHDKGDHTHRYSQPSGTGWCAAAHCHCGDFALKRIEEHPALAASDVLDQGQPDG